jgi:excisionase family DNA binding protein
MKQSSLMTPQQVADALGFETARPVYRMIREGQLPAVRLGTKLRIDRNDLDAMIARARTPRPRKRGGLRDLERRS